MQVPQKDIVVTASDDCTVQVYSVRTGMRMKTLHGHASRVLSLAALSTEFVGSGDANGELRIWNMRSWDCSYKESFVFVGNHSVLLARIHDTSFVVVVGKQLLFYQYKQGPGFLRTHKKSAVQRTSVVAIAANSERVVTAAEDGTAQVWDVKTKLPLTQVGLVASKVISVAVHMKMIYTGAATGHLRVFDSTSLVVCWNSKLSSQAITSVAPMKKYVSKDSSNVVCSTGNEIRFVSLKENSKPEQQDRNMNFTTRDTKQLKDGRMVVVGAKGKVIIFHPPRLDPGVFGFSKSLRRRPLWMRTTTATRTNSTRPLLRSWGTPFTRETGALAGMFESERTSTRLCMTDMELTGATATRTGTFIGRKKRKFESEIVSEGQGTRRITGNMVAVASKRARTALTPEKSLVCLEKEGIDIQQISTMKHMELATTLASFLIAYDSDLGDAYGRLQQSLQTAFKVEAIAGDILLGEDALVMEEFCAIVSRQLELDKIAFKGCILRLQRFSARLKRGYNDKQANV